MNVSAVNPAFQVLPKVFQPVDMGNGAIPVDAVIFLRAMFNGLMAVTLGLERAIRKMFIRVAGGTGRDILRNDRQKRWIIPFFLSVYRG